MLKTTLISSEPASDVRCPKKSCFEFKQGLEMKLISSERANDVHCQKNFNFPFRGMLVFICPKWHKAFCVPLNPEHDCAAPRVMAKYKYMVHRNVKIASMIKRNWCRLNKAIQLSNSSRGWNCLRIEADIGETGFCALL